MVCFLRSPPYCPSANGGESEEDAVPAGPVPPPGHGGAGLVPLQAFSLAIPGPGLTGRPYPESFTHLVLT